MKKLIRKLRRKQPAPDPSARITTETIAEHREKILAGGRRFKYPVQYARHRLVFNIIIIAVTVLIALTGLIGWQLYFTQTSNDFTYRVTRVLPLPVASVDGQNVLYSDYLMEYRSLIHYLQEKEQVSLKTDDGKRQADHYRQESMDDAVADAYALKLAKTNNINVSDAELQLFLQQRRESYGDVSQASYDAINYDYYGWRPDEYERVIRTKLLRQKVVYAVDTQATATVKAAEQAISSGDKDLKSVADKLNANKDTTVTYGESGWVPRENQDGGLVKAALKLAKGDISAAIKPTTGEGYYIIKLIDTNDTQVNYEFIHVALTNFDAKLAALKKANKVQIYITIPEDTEHAKS